MNDKELKEFKKLIDENIHEWRAEYDKLTEEYFIHNGVTCITIDGLQSTEDFANMLARLLNTIEDKFDQQ